MFLGVFADGSASPSADAVVVSSTSLRGKSRTSFEPGLLSHFLTQTAAAELAGLLLPLLAPPIAVKLSPANAPSAPYEAELSSFIGEGKTPLQPQTELKILHQEDQRGSPPPQPCLLQSRLHHHAAIIDMTIEQWSRHCVSNPSREPFHPWVSERSFPPVGTETDSLNPGSATADPATARHGG